MIIKRGYMRSKGGKIFYRCENCNSSNITKQVAAFDPLTDELKRTNLYICNTCNTYGFWKDRIKQAIDIYYESLKGSTIYGKRRFRRHHKWKAFGNVVNLKAGAKINPGAAVYIKDGKAYPYEM